MSLPLPKRPVPHLDVAISLCGRRVRAVDGGANIGRMTGYLLSRGDVRYVVAFEPGAAAWKELSASFGSNPRVTLNFQALGDQTVDKVWFGAAKPGQSPKLWHVDPTRKGLTQMTRLDDAIDPALEVNLIKLDLEGGEHRALLGATRILEHWRPVVVCETAEWLPQCSDRSNLFELMHDFNYVVRWTSEVDTVWSPKE